MVGRCLAGDTSVLSMWLSTLIKNNISLFCYHAINCSVPCSRGLLVLNESLVMKFEMIHQNIFRVRECPAVNLPIISLYSFICTAETLLTQCSKSGT
jgi:hypothetical protein